MYRRRTMVGNVKVLGVMNTILWEAKTLKILIMKKKTPNSKLRIKDLIQ